MMLCYNNCHNFYILIAVCEKKFNVVLNDYGYLMRMRSVTQEMPNKRSAAGARLTRVW